MTVISTIRLKNFKSFRKAEIPFSPGFTAIAGPNASGKSNVLDSLLFGMGITSLRLLRASRLTELVNHDATEGYAKVEIVIKDNSGKEILVTRMIDKQGKSVYKLDNRRKTLNEIESLLLELGINPNGHNIVVQGDITRVIEMNAKQRRQVIEEVAGLQEFEEKKDEALKKLEKVEQKVKDAHLILNEREAYLQQLEKDRENALRYNALSEEMKRSKATILSEEIKLIRKEMDKARQDLERMQKDIEGKRAERASLQEEERDLENKVEGITKRLIEAGEKTYTSFGKDVEQKKGHINLLLERAGAKKEAIGQKQERIARIGREIEQAKGLMEQRKIELQAAGQELALAKSELAELNKAISAKNPEFEKAQGEIGGTEDGIAQASGEISALKDELHSLAIARHGLERDAKAALSLLSELESERKRIGSRIAQKSEIEEKLSAFGKRKPAQLLAECEKGFEEAQLQLNVLRGRLEGESESLKRLQKAKSDCPTCEQPLGKGAKESVAARKGKEIAAMGERIAKLERDAQAKAEDKACLQKEEREYSQLQYSLTAFYGLEDEAARVEQRAMEAEKKISDAETGKIMKKEDALNARIAGLNGKKEQLEARLQNLKQAFANTEMPGLIARMQKLTLAASAKEGAVIAIRSELEHSITGRIKALEGESQAHMADIGTGQQAIGKIENERAATEKELAALEAELEKANRANKLLEEEKARLTAKIDAISRRRDEFSEKIESREKDLNELNIENSKNEVRIVDLEDEFRDYSAIEPFREFALNDIKKRIPEIEKEIGKLGAINMKSLENFDTFKKEVEDVRQKANKLDEERKAVIEMIAQIDVKKLNVFMECFNHVSAKFSELYYKFFEGEGQLELADKISPLGGGLLIQAKYKEDTMKSIDAMSGGEKSLTALAFLFAIQSYEPAPFYIFDEVDAALDKENSRKVGAMIKEQSSKSQFITISHNDAVINQADQIIGVAMNSHKSSVIGLRLKRGQHAITDNSRPGQLADGGQDDGDDGANAQDDSH